MFLEEAAAFFEKPEVQADFEKWKAENEKRKKSAQPAKTGNTLKLTRASVIIVHHTKHKTNVERSRDGEQKTEISKI